MREILQGGSSSQHIEEANSQHIKEIARDVFLNKSFRNALIKQEEIIKVISEIIKDKGIFIEDAKDIRTGVDIYFTDLMQRESNYRNQRLRFIWMDLLTNRSNSRFFDPILSSIMELNSPSGPRS